MMRTKLLEAAKLHFAVEYGFGENSNNGEGLIRIGAGCSQANLSWRSEVGLCQPGGQTVGVAKFA